MRRFALLSLMALAGGCACSRLGLNPPDDCLVDGEQVIASYYVQNVSYQLFSYFPVVSGVTWKTGGVAHQEDVEIEWFVDRATLDENMRSVDHACELVGSHRIGSISHSLSDDALWSFCILNRRLIRTKCLIYKPQPKTEGE